MRIPLAIVFMIAFLLQTYTELFAQTSRKEMETEIKEWDRQRLASLKSATGWVNLAGLYWLKPGLNTFGSDKSNSLVFNERPFPTTLGSFILSGKEVIWKTYPGQKVFEKNNPVDELSIFNLDSLKGSTLSFETYRWSIIKRENLVGVRFRDLANPALSKLERIDRFKPSLKWVVKARFVPAVVPTILTTNILGQTYAQPYAGKVIFEIDGQSYSLDAVDEGDPHEYHIVFGDETNGIETYASGRFLDFPKPDANNNTVLNFNKAYNPPCAFSEFSTCPIPTKANTLPVQILSGEKKVH